MERPSVIIAIDGAKGVLLACAYRTCGITHKTGEMRTSVVIATTELEHFACEKNPPNSTYKDQGAQGGGVFSVFQWLSAQGTPDSQSICFPRGELGYGAIWIKFSSFH
jgi:hypothetical protein